MTDKPDDFYDVMRYVIEGYKALAAYVEAIPADVVLPAMPGVDRDFYDSQADKADAGLAKIREQTAVAQVEVANGFHKRTTNWLKNLPDGTHLLYAAPVAAPVHKKCDGCNGHGMLGNGHPDCSDVVCHFCEGTGVNRSPAAPAAHLQVWFGSMPESNGKANWTAILHRGDITQGITIDRSEYKDRVRYEADRMRWMIGVLEEEPDILQYDASLHSGYKAPAVPAPRYAMIDEKAILQWELDAEEAGLKQHAEIIRNARRYLALRENEVAILNTAVNSFDAETYRADYDAAADRLLEGGE